MLDTLKLSLMDYEIDGDADLTVQPPTFNAATGERAEKFPLYRKGKGHVLGVRAYHNAEDFNVDVKPLNPNEPMAIGCWVEFSVPKVARGSNFKPADYLDTKGAITMVQRKLTKLGIKTNLKTAKISRLDSCKRPETQEAYHAYQPVLSMMQGQRMAKREYGTTFLWHNTVQEICVYDKIEEMKRRKHPVKGLPQNVVSFEHRLLKARKVRDATGLSNVTDLLDGFEQVGICYREAMKKQLFKHEPADVEVMTANHFVEQLTRLKESSAEGSTSRYYVQEYLTSLAFHKLGADADAFMSAVEQVSDNRATRSQVKKKLQAARANALSMEKSLCSNRTLGELYRELEQEVLGAY
jgi:hypothetical protein